MFRKLTGRTLVPLAAMMLIAGGCITRLLLWIKNRDLMMDEVNVVRNIFERDFTALLTPLDYNQYAPPVFLWSLKLAGIVAGYSEQTMRFVPLICSMLSLIVLWRLLKHLLLKTEGLYALALFSFSFIYLMYAVDVKQYASDALIVLLLLFGATRHVPAHPRWRVALGWSLAGIAAIWCSMPSIFILAGIGSCFIYRQFRSRAYGWPQLVTVFTAWVIAFLAYYQLLLKRQIGSDYLQNWHANYFLILQPQDNDQWAQNGRLMEALLGSTFGSQAAALSLVVNTLFIVAGIVHLAWKQKGLALLLVVPLLGLIAASCMRHFTMLPRVCIFIMPVFLLLAAYGIKALASVSLKPVKWLVCLLVLTCLGITADRSFKSSYEIDELRKSVSFALGNNTSYKDIYVHEFCAPVIHYLTSIHPDSQAYKAFNAMHVIGDGSNATELVGDTGARKAVIYFWVDGGVFDRQMGNIRQHMKGVDSLVATTYKVFVFESPAK